MTIRAVHHLNCATLCPVASFLLGSKRLICHCLLLETARDGLVLVDTGFGTRDTEGKTKLPRSFKRIVRPVLDGAETADAQLRALGFAPADVRHIVVTHLDIDHAGGLSDFPHAKVHLHAREHAAAMARASYLERQRYASEHWHHGPAWEVYAEDGDTWRGLPAIAKLRGVDADIGLLPLHGHTRGHSAVIVRSPDERSESTGGGGPAGSARGAGVLPRGNIRWLVHAGDAYFHRNTVEGTGRVPLGIAAFERVMQRDGAQRRASVAALRQLRESYTDLALFCAHSVAEWSALRDAVQTN